MKMKWILLLTVLLVSVALAESRNILAILTPSSTAIAANTTNTTAGTVLVLDAGTRHARIYMTASGTASTTNGVYVARLATSPDSNNWEQASLSSIILTNSVLQSTTNTVSSLIDLTGAKYLRIAWEANTCNGPVSNKYFQIVYPK